jgi:hemerythrin-like metal-binding protein
MEASMVIEWSAERHGLGIPGIDSQHQELFLVFNRLAELAEAPDSPDRTRGLVTVLKRLYAYCHFHFNTEIELLRRHLYPEVREHVGLHGGFTMRVKEFIDTVRSSPHPDVGPILDSLVDWIVNHIMDEDRKYADWLHRNGIEAELHAGHSPWAAVGDEALELWNQKRLGLDIKGIDEQHRELVMVLAQANDLLRAAPERQRMFLPAVIQKLFYYSQFHFSFEEELMARHRWAGLPAHRELHALFIRRLTEFAEAYNQRRQGLTGEIVTFLREWTVSHILEEDRQFKDCLKGTD